MAGVGIGLVVVALATSGCSFLFVTPASDDHAQRAYVRCTRHYVSPIIDTAVSGTAVLAAVALGTESNQAFMGSTGQQRGATIAWGVTAAVVGVSAIYGYTTVSTCREAVDDTLDHRYRDPRSVPPPPGYGYPPPGYGYPPPGYAPPPGYGYPPPGYAPPPGSSPYSPPPPASGPPPAPTAPPPGTPAT
jgi:hypothetical protein